MALLDDFIPLIRGRLPGCPDLILKDAARSACIEFCQRTRLLTEQASFATVSGQAQYPLFLATGLPWELCEVKIDEGVLSPASRHEAVNGGYADVMGTPRLYYLDGSGMLVLAPTPDAALTVTVRATVRPEDDAEEVDDALWQDYREAIAAGARAFVRRHYGDWINPAAEMDDRGLFELAMDRANLRRARGGTRAPLRIRSHAF